MPEEQAAAPVATPTQGVETTGSNADELAVLMDQAMSSGVAPTVTEDKPAAPAKAEPAEDPAAAPVALEADPAEPTDQQLSDAQDLGGTVLIEGKKWTASEVQQEFENRGLRQADYTRKTQDLSTREKALEPIIQISQFADRLSPEGRKRIVDTINEVGQSELGFQSGVAQIPGSGPTQSPAAIPQAPSVPVGTPQADKLKAAGYEQDVVDAVAAIESGFSQTAQGHERAIRTLIEQNRELVGMVRGDTEAKAAVASLKVDGFEATEIELRQAQQTTGIQDMEAAWLKLNKPRLRSAAPAAPAPNGVKPAPRATPASDTKVFEIEDGTTSDEIFNAILMGQHNLPPGYGNAPPPPPAKK
jgi:hypothetical protein